MKAGERSLAGQERSFDKVGQIADNRWYWWNGIGHPCIATEGSRADVSDKIGFLLTTPPISADDNKATRRAGGWLMFLLTLLVLNRLEWPFTIRLYDWRLNEVLGSLILIATSIAAILFGLSLDRRLLGIILALPGLILLISVFSFVMLDLPRTFSRPNPYDFEPLDSVSVGAEKYRLYSTDSGGVGAISYDLLRRERDTPFGFKLVRTLWANSYNGSELKLQTINDSIIEILDKSDGKIVAVIKQ